MLTAATTIQAGSATWNATPTSGYWGFADNWTPATVPSGPTDTATFNVSSITTLNQMSMSVGTVVFNPGASAYTLNPFNPGIGTIAGAGIINDSGVTQIINVPAVPQFAGDEESYNLWMFANDATAGDLVQYNVYGSSCGDGKTDDAGWVKFENTATAGSATFIVNSGTKGYYDCHGGAGSVDFVDSSSAGTATFINNGGLVRDGNEANTSFSNTATAANATITNYGGTFNRMEGAWVRFYDESNAGNATITNEAGQRQGALGGFTQFFSTATAGNATLIANGGIGEGGKIEFETDSTGGTARVEVFGNANLDISTHNSPGVTIGSVEGDGDVFLGTNNLTIGSNNLGTTFAGLIQGNGSVSKIGTATLTLTNANEYTKGTTINGGFLLAGNTSGSATGRGPVAVNTGTIGGDGTIAGTVTIGTGNGTGAALGPGRNSVTPGSLTIQKKLQLKADATYRVTLNSNTPAADQVTARGIQIVGAQIAFSDGGSTALATGTAFTVINNIAATPISGTFTSLPDGGTVTVGSNTYQANYEGGDGNDLTLTVVP